MSAAEIDVPEIKEWVKVSRSAQGQMVVTVTLVSGNLTSKWAARASMGEIKDAVSEARTYATRMLDKIREATGG